MWVFEIAKDYRWDAQILVPRGGRSYEVSLIYGAGAEYTQEK
jgi:hypothetical protein